MHTTFCIKQKVPVLFGRSTEQNHKTSLAYLYDFEHFGPDLSSAYESIVPYVWHGNLQRLVCTLL